MTLAGRSCVPPVGRPLWVLFMLMGGTMEVPILAFTFILNDWAKVPVEFLSAYGAVSFLPWSLKPLYAALDVHWSRKLRKERKSLLLFCFAASATSMACTALIPAGGVPLCFVLGIARGFTMALTEFLLGLTLLENAARVAQLLTTSQEESTSFDAVAGIHQSQAATARNIGSFISSLTVLLAAYFHRSLHGGMTRVFSTGLLLTAAALLLMAALLLLCLGLDTAPIQHSHNHNNQSQHDPSGTLHSILSLPTRNTSIPFTQLMSPVELQGIILLQILVIWGGLRGPIAQSHATLWIIGFVTCVLLLAGLCTTSCIRHTWKTTRHARSASPPELEALLPFPPPFPLQHRDQPMQSNSQYPPETPPTLNTHDLPAPEPTTNQQRSPQSTPDHSNNSPAFNPPATTFNNTLDRGLALYLTLHHSLPQSSYQWSSYLYTILGKDNPTLLQVLHVVSSFSASGGSATFGKYIAPWCVSRQRLIWVIVGLTLVYGAMSLAYVGVYKVLSRNGSSSSTGGEGSGGGEGGCDSDHALENFWVLMPVTLLSSFVYEMQFLPSVVLATASVKLSVYLSQNSCRMKEENNQEKQGDPHGNNGVIATGNGDTDNVFMDCHSMDISSTGQIHEPLCPESSNLVESCNEEACATHENTTCLSSSAGLQYGTYVACIDFGDQLSSWITVPLVSSLGIHRGDWSSLPQLMLICTGIYVASLVFLILLTPQKRRPFCR